MEEQQERIRIISMWCEKQTLAVELGSPILKRHYYVRPTFMHG